MPTYEYVCSSCANAWEEIQKITEPPVEVCPKCGQHTARRQISAGNFILKGGGWYADLYSSAKPPAASKTDDSATPAAAGASTDAKPAAAKEATAPAVAAPAPASSTTSGSKD